MSTAGGIWKALQRGVGIGCEIIQVFVKNNMQWFGKPFSPSSVAKFANELAASKLAGVFLDTGHFFEAGYDLRSLKGWNRAIAQVESLIGLNQVLAFHLNDSKTELGSRVDRHAGIGRGKIGRESFRRIVNDDRFRDSPGCLETPKSADLHEDVENLAILRSLVE